MGVLDDKRCKNNCSQQLLKTIIIIYIFILNPTFK